MEVIVFFQTLQQVLQVSKYGKQAASGLPTTTPGAPFPISQLYLCKQVGSISTPSSQCTLHPLHLDPGLSGAGGSCRGPYTMQISSQP